MKMSDQKTSISRTVKVRPYREGRQTSSIHSLLPPTIGEKTEKNSSSDDDELTAMMRRVRVSKRSRRKKPRQRGTMASLRSSSGVLVPVPVAAPAPAPLRVSVPMPIEKTVTLLGHGRDASYDYRDTFMVQAIMKTFNGAASATRVVDDFVACHGRRPSAVARQPEKEEECRRREEAEREKVR